MGVEHLLRDINDPTTSSLALQIKQKKTGLDGLLSRLTEIRAYLDKVISGRIPINNQIAYNLQNIINLLPNLNVDELVKSMLVKTNDMHLVMYVSSLIRAIIALHDLLNNKLKYKNLDDILDQDASSSNAAAAAAATEKKDKEPKSPGSPSKQSTTSAEDSSESKN